MRLRCVVECVPVPDAGRERLAAWFTERPAETVPDCRPPSCVQPTSPRRLPKSEALRLRGLIEAAIRDVFGVPQAELSAQSRGKAPVALARQAAMYLAHVSCGLTFTDVGHIFARDRTTVAHACAVIEDRRDDPVFDHALELMEWIVPTLVGHDQLHQPLSGT